MILPFLASFPIKIEIVHSYVSLPEGNCVVMFGCSEAVFPDCVGIIARGVVPLE